MNYVSLGNNDLMFEVPLSKGLYIGSHEGVLFMYHKKAKIIFDSDESIYNCLDIAVHLAHTFKYQDYNGLLNEYYFDDDLIRLSYIKARNYELQDIISYECDDCDNLCGNNRCPSWSGDFPMHHPETIISNPLNNNWWTINDILTVKTPKYLKDIDPKHSHYHLLLECKIKHIGKPKKNSKFKRYEQKITLYSDDSQKEIKSLIIDNEVFFEDEFESGDTVVVIGDYFSTHEIPFQIHKMKRVKKSEKKKSRNQENPEYLKWKDSIVSRDEVCQCCGDKDKLEVHHYFSYAKHESLQVDEGNGVALCKWCHSKYHSKYGYGDRVNPATFNEFVKNHRERFQ